MMAPAVSDGVTSTTVAGAPRVRRQGFGLLAVGADTWWLTDSARREVEALRKAGKLGS